MTRTVRKKRSLSSSTITAECDHDIVSAPDLDSREPNKWRRLGRGRLTVNRVVQDLFRTSRTAISTATVGFFRDAAPPIDDDPRPIDAAVHLINHDPQALSDDKEEPRDPAKRLPRWRSELARETAQEGIHEEVVRSARVQHHVCAPERLPRWRNESHDEEICSQSHSTAMERMPRWRAERSPEESLYIPHLMDEAGASISVTQKKFPRWRREWTLENMIPFKRQCEALYTQGCIADAADRLSMIADVASEADRSVADWIAEFANRCVKALERTANEALAVQKYEEAIATYSTAMSLRHSTSPPDPLLTGWVKTMLIRRSADETLYAATQFRLPKFIIYHKVCDILEEDGRIVEAVACFRLMESELVGDTDSGNQRTQWELDFRRRFSKKMEHLGDTAADAKRHDEAISHYTTALSLDSLSLQGILIKRSKAFVANGSWKEGLDDANQSITLDPSSPRGYEVKHAALHKAGDYDAAVDAFETMLSKFAQSPDPDVQQDGDQYISPSCTQAKIRDMVQKWIRHLPRVLINATTGRLQSKAEQASTFESLPIFKQLVSSTTTRINYARIKREVRQHFQYVMLSHKWEANEPLFKQVAATTVYDLESFPTHDKLKRFCEIVRDGGFAWAWSDTCCIDKSDHFVLQEALVAMFKWYQGSALTIIFLRGVRSSSKLGALVRSLWNTRAWTLQEYVASKIVHFYTEDWTFYLHLQIPNHKDSQEIVSEMEQATGVSADELMALRPGLSSIREKLRLASVRETTFVEDAAYSLLGIFSVTGLPAIYGEGEGSLGRLLAHVLAGSGDVSILAWTGESGSFNSCLPAQITVFNRPATSHLLPPIPDDEMERIVAESHSSAFDLDAALSLYDRLSELPAPWFAASRMKLPCITFQLPLLSYSRTRSFHVYLADTTAFGRVEIRTRHDLSRMKVLYLVHPWLDSLLEPDDTHGNAFAGDENATLGPGDDEDISDGEDVSSGSGPEPEPDSPAHAVPTSASRAVHAVPEVVPMDRETRARRLVARLRQPFGALLVTATGTGRRATPDYRRVAPDGLITVRFRENLPLTDVLDNVRTLDVL